MKRVATLTIAVALVLVPATAFAAYMAQQLEGKPIVEELIGQDTRTNEWRVVGTKTIPQSKLDNILTDAKTSLTISKKENLTLTADELKNREEAGKNYMKAIAKYNADGEINAVERLMLIAGL